MIRIMFEDRASFKAKFGEELLNKYLAIRNKITDPIWKDMDVVARDRTPEELEQYINNFQSNTQKKKQNKIEGSEKIYSDKDWDVIKVTSYPAMAQIGYGTKWCIAGNYQGHESEGQYYFNEYLKKMAVPYYLVYIDKKINTKYCVLKYTTTFSIYNAADKDIEFIPRAPAIKGFEPVSCDPASDPVTLNNLLNALDDQCPGRLPEHLPPEEDLQIITNSDYTRLELVDNKTGEVYVSGKLYSDTLAAAAVVQEEEDNAHEYADEYFYNNTPDAGDLFECIESYFSDEELRQMMGEKRDLFLYSVYDDFVDCFYNNDDEANQEFKDALDNCKTFQDVFDVSCDLGEGCFNTQNTVDFLCTYFDDAMARMYIGGYSSIMSMPQWALVEIFYDQSKVDHYVVEFKMHQEGRVLEDYILVIDEG